MTKPKFEANLGLFHIGCIAGANDIVKSSRTNMSDSPESSSSLMIDGISSF
jgi:hypothetical protein